MRKVLVPTYLYLAECHYGKIHNEYIIVFMFVLLYLYILDDFIQLQDTIENSWQRNQKFCVCQLTRARCFTISYEKFQPKEKFYVRYI